MHNTSFLIPIQALNETQFSMIEDHMNIATQYMLEHPFEIIYSENKRTWRIEREKKCLFGYTFQIDFDMEFFLEHIANVDFKYIIWNNNSAFCDLDLLNNKILKNNRKTKINNLYHD
jgi:hypothetical protein